MLAIMWNLKKITDLIAQGKIRGAVIPPAAAGMGHAPTKGRRVAKHYPRGDAAKNWLSLFLLAWCQQRSLVLREEYRFHEVRKWRFDWCVEERMIAVEYEGLGFQKTGHTESHRYSDNTDKYNTATAMGWKVFRVTYLNYMTLAKKFEEYEKFIADGKHIK